MIGSHIAQSAAGAPGASRAVARDKRKEVAAQENARARDEDVVDVPVSEVERTEPVRHVGANGEEDSREDRQESGYYSPTAKKKPHKGENLDLKA
jgi:hypothetical protein